MLLPGRTNRAVKNLFVGNLKWGARLPEVHNRHARARGVRACARGPHARQRIAHAAARLSSLRPQPPAA